MAKRKKPKKKLSVPARQKAFDRRPPALPLPESSIPKSGHVLVLIPPDAPAILDASADEVLAWASNASEDSFKQGNGELQIEFYSQSLTSGLGALYRARYGFVLTHRASKPAEADVSWSIGDNGCRDRVSVFYAGDFVNYPLGNFVAAELAAEAIRHFCLTGLRSTTVEWGGRLVENDLDDICADPY